MNVIISNAENYASVYFMNSLAKKGIETVTLSDRIFSPGFFSFSKKKFHACPNSGYENYHFDKRQMEIFVHCINKISEKYKPAMLLPLMENVILPVSINRDKVSVPLFLPPHESIMIAHDKRRTVKFCQKNSIRVPKTLSLSRNELKNVGHEKFPLAVRPAISYGGSVSDNCDNNQQLVNSFDKIINNGQIPLMQEFLKGEKFSVLCVFDNKSRPVMTFTSKSLRIGNSVIFTVLKGEKKVERIATNALKKLKWVGLAYVQFIKVGKKYYLTEINPRFGNSLTFAMNYGINIPFILYNSLLGNKVKIKKILEEKIFFVYPASLALIKRFGFVNFLRMIKADTLVLDHILPDDPIASFVIGLQDLIY